MKVKINNKVSDFFLSKNFYINNYFEEVPGSKTTKDKFVSQHSHISCYVQCFDIKYLFAASQYPISKKTITYR